MKGKTYCVRCTKDTKSAKDHRCKDCGDFKLEAYEEDTPLKVLDLFFGAMSLEAKQMLIESGGIVYIDNSDMHKEHIYDVNYVLESLEGTKQASEPVYKELQNIGRLMDKRGCSYVRIIN